MKAESLETIGLKAAPAVGYIGATLGGMSIPDWAATLACIYTLGLLAQMAYRFIQFLRARRAARVLAEAAGKAEDYGADRP
jgi:hypothetical protein